MTCSFCYLWKETPGTRNIDVPVRVCVCVCGNVHVCVCVREKSINRERKPTNLLSEMEKTALGREEKYSCAKASLADILRDGKS